MQYYKKNYFNLKHARYEKISLPFSIYTLIVTWFYVGRIGFASGTFGSLAFYPIYQHVIKNSFSEVEAIQNFWIITIILFAIGWLATSIFQKKTNTYDHACIVIDEVIGMSLTFALSLGWISKISENLMLSLNISSYNLTFILGFVAFRIFDIKKPLIIGYIDNRYKNAFAVILDDILAACFAAGIFYIMYEVYEFIRFF